MGKKPDFSCQMLTLVPRYRFANALPGDRIIHEVEGEAFAQK